MHDERARRRPSFQPGLSLRLADGQFWSLPIPADAPGEPAVSPRAWDDPDYRAILQALREAEDPGERFRAELALAIRLLSWNYDVDRDDLGALFDDGRVGRIGVDLSRSLSQLARAHLGFETVEGRVEIAPGSIFGRLRVGIARIVQLASRSLGRQGGRRPSGQSDRPVYSSIARPSRSSSTSAR